MLALCVLAPHHVVKTQTALHHITTHRHRHILHPETCKEKTCLFCLYSSFFFLHLVSGQMEGSESIPGQSGRTQAFEHQGANVGLVTCSQIL